MTDMLGGQQSPNKEVTFYSRLHGTRFIMPKGEILQFVGGEYKTSNPAEIYELTAAVKTSSGIQLSLTKVPLKRAGGDAHIMRDVSNTGPMSSGTVGKMAQLSGK